MAWVVVLGLGIGIVVAWVAMAIVLWRDDNRR